MDLQLVNPDVEAFYRFCAERPQGVTTEDLQAAGWVDQGQVMSAAQELLNQGRLSLTQVGQGQLMYSAVDPQTAAKFRGLEREHMLVYQQIEKAGDKGAWSKFIKDQTNLQQHTITKVTKELIRRQLIKEVKSVQHRGRKVFMLWDIEPDKAVSGGTWYQDGEFAASWIESLRDRCLQFLENNNGRVVSLQDVHAFIQQQPGPSTPTQEDVAAIMRTLQLDEVVYSMQSSNGQMVYAQRQRGANGEAFDLFAGRAPKFVTQAQDEVGLVVPCLLCPLSGECHVGGRISPEKCDYIGNWLKGTQAEPAASNARDLDARMNDW